MRFPEKTSRVSAFTIRLGSILSVGLLLLGLQSSNLWAKDAVPETNLPSHNTKTKSECPQTDPSLSQDTSDPINEIRGKQQADQKKAYDAELNRRWHKIQPFSTAIPNPWVPVRQQGTVTGNAEYPAVSKPEVLKSTIQFDTYQYRLKPGDKLAFYGMGLSEPASRLKPHTHPDADLLPPALVLPDGTVAIPPLGQVNAAGKTLAELNDTLNSQLRPYYRFAQITASLIEMAPEQVLVLGQIKQQGYVQVPAGTRLSQLVATAGGVGDKADLSRVYLHRKADDMVYQANLLAVMGQAKTQEDLLVQAGDIVVIPEAQMPFSYPAYLIGPLMPEAFRVKVLGAVENPDVIDLKPGDNLTAALAKAGGIKRRARNHRITVIREDREDRSYHALVLHPRDLLSPYTHAHYDITLKPNDLVVVEE